MELHKFVVCKKKIVRTNYPVPDVLNHHFGVDRETNKQTKKWKAKKQMQQMKLTNA